MASAVSSWTRRTQRHGGFGSAPVLTLWQTASVESRDSVGTVAVIGLGTMGTGIAEVVARHGFAVRAIDIDDTSVSDARQRIEASTDRAVARDKLTASERSGILDRILFTTNLQECLTSDIVIEAVPENLELKRQVLGQLDGLLPDRVIWCTNTSSLSVTEISTAVSRPSRVVGLHFFNPAPVQDLWKSFGPWSPTMRLSSTFALAEQSANRR